MYIGFSLESLEKKFSSSKRKEFEQYLQNEIIAAIDSITRSKFSLNEKLSDDDLFYKIHRIHITSLETTMANYIARAKQRRLTVDDMRRKAYDFDNDNQLKTFYSVANYCYEVYEVMLKNNHSHDFNDILRMAIDETHIIKKLPIITNKTRLQNNKTKQISIDLSKLEYLIVDEFQDVSMLFYEMIQSLRLYNPNLKIICV